MRKEHTSKEIKYRLSDLGVQIGNIAIEYIANLEKQNNELQGENKQAKELIREYMRFEPMIGSCAFYSEEYEKTKKKAEAFLKEK